MTARFFMLMEQIVNYLWCIERQQRINTALLHGLLSNSSLKYGTENVVREVSTELAKLTKERPPYAVR